MIGISTASTFYAENVRRPAVSPGTARVAAYASALDPPIVQPFRHAPGDVVHSVDRLIDWGDGSTEFGLNWTASTDNATSPEFIHHDVYLNGVWPDATVGHTRMIGYAEFGENTLKVIAVDEAGHESSAATVGPSIP